MGMRAKKSLCTAGVGVVHDARLWLPTGGGGDDLAERPTQAEPPTHPELKKISLRKKFLNREAKMRDPFMIDHALLWVAILWSMKCQSASCLCKPVFY